MNKTLLFTLLSLLQLTSYGQHTRELLDFKFEGIKLSGVLNFPQDLSPKGIVLIVNGDGRTNAVEENWWLDVRNSITKAGFATFMWDKMGCGNSQGTYKNGRPVENEALEVIEAIKNLKANKIKGSNKIGLWGISRAGWINPIVIDQFDKVDFWISVSGVDGDETFDYLLEQNLRIEGHQQDTIHLILNEWRNSIWLSHGGASYTTYLSASENLRKNTFWKKINNGSTREENYYEYQKILQKAILDKDTQLPLYIENFNKVLSEINVPVLALFGETDMTVDWKKTKALYEKTIQVNSDLTIVTFPNCNHNMWQAKTGGFYEFEDRNWTYTRCDGFLDSITNWLNELK